MGGTDATGLTERDLRASNAEALMPLSEEAGWNQVEADWRFMLESGRGFGITDSRGRFVASALTHPVGPGLRWVGMVLTLRESRRSGFGMRLLRRCVDDAVAGGDAAGLDATELGRPLYSTLGFRELYRLSRWRLEWAGAPAAPAAGVAVRSATAADLGAIAALDARYSGMQRAGLLAHLLRRAPAIAHLAEAEGRPRGFVLGRDGRSASQIGPIVAESEDIALALLQRAASAGTSPFLIDVPDRHETLRRWLAAAGAIAPRGFWRMVRGDAPGLDDASHLFALAGPELG